MATKWILKRQNDNADNVYIAPLVNGDINNPNYNSGICLEPGGELILPGKNMRISDEINSLKSSVSNGKNGIASAITGKGIAASGSDSFSTLSNKIGQIVVGGRSASSNGWVGVDASTYNAAWNINVGFKPKVVFYQFRIVYGVVNIYNDHVYMRVFGHGMMTVGGSASTTQHVQNDGYTIGPQSGFATAFLVGEYNSDPINYPDEAIDWTKPKQQTGLTSTGFTLNYGYLFGDSRGGNWANLNWIAYE